LEYQVSNAFSLQFRYNLNQRTMPKITLLNGLTEKHQIMSYLGDFQYPIEFLKEDKRSFRRKVDKFQLVSGQLYYKHKGKVLKYIQLPEESEIAENEIRNLHFPGHLGMTQLWLAIREQFYGITQEMVHNFVRNCEDCVRNEPLKRVDKMQFITAKAPMERLIIDLIDMRKFSAINDEYTWILAIIDSFSKFAFTEKIKAKSAIQVLNCLKKLFLREGYPDILHSDNGKEFKNGLLAEFARKNGFILVRGRARYPQSQGQAERFNQTLCRRLSKHLFSIQEKRWVDIIDEIVFQYNDSIHCSTNQKPFVLFRNRNGRTPLSLEAEIVYESEASSEDDYDAFENFVCQIPLRFDLENVENTRKKYLL
jgi:Integrase core domain